MGPIGLTRATGVAILSANYIAARLSSHYEVHYSGGVPGIDQTPRAITAFRQLAGGTDPVEKATPGTIRGDFGLETQFNLVHGSDGPESAAREIKLWFPNL